MVIIRSILHQSDEFKKAVFLRQLVLRTPLKLSFTEEELDAEWNQIHIAAIDSNKILGVLSLMILDNGLIKMRQVAVDPIERCKGIGKNLVIFAEEWAHNEGYRLMVLNARKTAIEFYQKLNYKLIGEEFTEVGIPHFKMEKEL